MISKERVLHALNLKKQDRLPFLELLIDTVFGTKLLGKLKEGGNKTQNKFFKLPVLIVPTIGSNYNETKEIVDKYYFN